MIARVRRALRLPWSSVWRDRSGAAALEFALVAPTLFLLIMGGMEFSKLLWTQSALQMSAAQAERCLSWNICTSSNVAAFAANVAPQLQFPTGAFKVTSAGCVTATYQYNFIVQGLLPPYVTAPSLSATSCFSSVPSS